MTTVNRRRKQVPRTPARPQATPLPWNEIDLAVSDTTVSATAKDVSEPPALTTFTKVSDLVAYDPRLDPYAKCVYMAGLTRHWDVTASKGMIISQADLAVLTGMGETKLRESIKLLLFVGLFRLARRGGHGQANVYSVVQCSAVPALYRGEREVSAWIGAFKAGGLTEAKAIQLGRERQAFHSSAREAAREQWSTRKGKGSRRKAVGTAYDNQRKLRDSEQSRERLRAEVRNLEGIVRRQDKALKAPSDGESRSRRAPLVPTRLRADG